MKVSYFSKQNSSWNYIRNSCRIPLPSDFLIISFIWICLKNVASLVGCSNAASIRSKLLWSFLRPRIKILQRLKFQNWIKTRWRYDCYSRQKYFYLLFHLIFLKKKILIYVESLMSIIEVMLWDFILKHSIKLSRAWKGFWFNKL